MLTLPFNREPLLTASEVRSDELVHSTATEPAQSRAHITLCIENLYSVNGSASGHVLSVPTAETVARLKESYLARLRADAAASPSMPHLALDHFEHHVRLIYDGSELPDGETVESCGLAEGARVCAVSMRRRRGAVAWALHQLFRWWPVCAALLLFTLLFLHALDVFGADAAAARSAAHCNADRLRQFLFVSSPLLLVYAAIVSGMFQDDRGRRLLWFLRLHTTAAVLSLMVAVFALVWFYLGSAWIFGDEASCRDVRPNIFYPALVCWLLLLLVNLPWLIACLLPAMLYCKCKLALAIIARLSGVQGGAMQR
uniref:Ubiquitin-like domain-containing protein n=1 Tax=Chrysotila carterae TaxID=13221 RepID=A0A7S4B225_CHRCT|mmetsp:Transcript_50289/g.108974  ORF Transcript_50289/g.108974 Transcript_50289/m.108974 type:complete len:313 (+) Transcript_50289:262-1200(+)